MVRVHQIKVVVKPLKNLTRDEMITEQRNLINSAISEEEELLKFHKNGKERLPYCFSQIVLRKEDKSYSRNKVYDFMIRASDNSLVLLLKNLLFTFANSKFNKTNLKVISIKNIGISYDFVSKIKSKSPILLMDNITEGKFNKEHMNKTLNGTNPQLLEHINRSAIRKYNKLMDENVPLDTLVFTRHDVLREIVKVESSYKNKPFYKIGFTVELKCNLDKTAQKIVELALNVGIGSSSSFLGAGFMTEIH